MAKQTIGEFLATLRKANGYTQQEVADRLGISNRTLSGWECDKVLPDILLLPVLAEIYSVTVDEILAGERNSTRNSDTKNIVFSFSAERQFLQNKLNRFTTRAYSLLATSVVGFILIFFGWYLDTANAGQYRWQWWLLILIGGLVAVAVSTIMLFALWRCVALTNVNSAEHYGIYRILACKRFTTILYIISAVSFLMPIFQVVVHITMPSKILGYWFYTLLSLTIVYSITLFVAGVRLFNSTKRKYQASVNCIPCKGLIKKVFLFGLIPFALALITVITLACVKPTEHRVLYSSYDSVSFINHLETFADDENEYLLPLSTYWYAPGWIEDCKIDNTLYKFGHDDNAFYCNFSQHNCNVRNEKTNSDGTKTVSYRNAQLMYMICREDNRWIVSDEKFYAYNVRYANLENDLLEKDFITYAKCDIEFVYWTNEISYQSFVDHAEFYVDIQYDYTALGLECAAILLSLDLVVCTAVVISKRQKCSLSL